MRDGLFLSHANPEDNDFTRWLALQLASQGYRVWCDLTQLLGGEDFWTEAEGAIRHRAVKLIYILSEVSNAKVGPLQELQVAQNVARDAHLDDFIIPVLIDDLPPRQFNIQLGRINAIPFSGGWAKGLETLFGKLEKDAVPKSPEFSPVSVASWWRSQFSADQGVQRDPEEYLSNWFAIECLPRDIYLHELKRAGIGRLDVPAGLPYPAFAHHRFIVSFARAEDFAGHLGSFVSVENTHAIPTTSPEAGLPALRSLDRRQMRDFIVRLLGLAWDQMIRKRRLQTYELSGGVHCFYFTRGLAPNDRVWFTGVDGKQTYRKVVGQHLNDNWHFGIRAKPLIYPTAAYIIRPHVLFSDDGSHVWDSKPRLHRARRSHCRNWWNAEWRDRILAAMSWLSDGKGRLEIELGSDSVIQVLAVPITFTSPVSYRDPEKEVPPILDREADDVEDDLVGGPEYEDMA